MKVPVLVTAHGDREELAFLSREISEKCGIWFATLSLVSWSFLAFSIIKNRNSGFYLGDIGALYLAGALRAPECVYSGGMSWLLHTYCCFSRPEMLDYLREEKKNKSLIYYQIRC